jgi:rhodanese-related sulfurtransferase
MARTVDTIEVQKLLADGAQLVEVLPAEEYRTEHLPGAVNIPLRDIAGASGQLELDRPVIVYCFDHECDLSSRAASRLDALGFVAVYDYVPSKVAWLADGLPSEGSVDDRDRAGSRAHHDVPTVPLGATLANVKAVLGDWEVVVVLTGEGIVAGTVDRNAAALGSDLLVASVMRADPPTVRPSITRRELAASMDDDRRSHVLVTTHAGRLIGLVRRRDLALAR